MGLFIGYVDIWNTKKPGNRKRLAYWDLFVLNTNRMSDIHEIHEGEALNFLYSEDPDDSRDSPGYIEAYITPFADALEEVRFFQDLVPSSKFETLPIFPDMDITQTPVDTLVEWNDIAYAYATYQDFERDTCHLVYYRNAWQRVECIVDMTWLELWFDQA